MGLFNFLGGSSKNSPNLLVAEEFTNLDIEGLLARSEFYEEHEYQGQFNSVTYEAELDKLFLNIFDGIRLRVGSTEKDPDKVIIVTFVVLHRQPKISEIASLVANMNRLMKKHDDDWTDVDVMRIESGVWRGRTYMLNPGMVMIQLDEFDGISMSITGFKTFLDGITTP